MPARFISHVQVPVLDMEKSIAWYVNVLGFKFLANFNKFSILSFSESGCNIHLWKTEDRTAATFTVGGKAWPTIGFEVDDMDDLCAKIVESKVEIEGDGLAAPDGDGRRFIRFFDINGNMLVAHQEPTNV